MVQSVQVLAHDQSLSPLLDDLFSGKWSKKEANHHGVEENPVSSGCEESSSSFVGEIVVSNENNIGGCSECSCQGGSEEALLRVVHSVHNSFVFLPVVVFHTYLLIN